MLFGLCGAAEVRNPGGSLTWTRVNMVGFHSGLANGLVVKYSLTPVQKVKEPHYEKIQQKFFKRVE